ncbi:MAG: alpha/beta fold hydrolase, partial [Pseudomonadales bacterium]|nr:alpha/beta fold hydrolase [Pseudomonadales bacterium]
MTGTSPPVRYAHGKDGRRIALMSLGRGPALIEVPHIQMSHLHLEWQLPAVRRWCQAITQRHRLIRFDNNGCGLSSDQTGDFSLDSLASDILTVVDALHLDQFALFGRITGGLPAIVFAARYPERVSHLVLWNSFTDHARHGGQARMKAVLGLAASDWQLFTESISQAALGWQDGPAARTWAEVLRAASSQPRFLQYLDARKTWDVRPIVSQVRAKTLVLYDQANQLVNAERSQELASFIRNAELRAIDSDTGVPGEGAIRVIKDFLGTAAPSTVILPELTRREN